MQILRGENFTQLAIAWAKATAKRMLERGLA
jgi:hypothetical protein